MVKKIATRLAEDPEQMIVGRVVNGIPGNVFSVSSQLMRDAAHVYLKENDWPAHSLASDNLVVPAGCFRALGGFDKSLRLGTPSVREFYERWRQCGYRMTYAPEVVVKHIHALSLYDFIRRQFRHGRDSFCFHSFRDRKGWQPLWIDSKFYLHLFSYSFFRVRARRAFLLEGVMMASYLAYISGFIWQKLHCAIAHQKPHHNSSEALP